MTNTFEIGGSERQCVTLAKTLSPASFRVQVGCLRRFGPLQDELKSIKEFPLGGNFLSAKAARSSLALRRHLRAQRTAIAHAFDFYTNLMMIPVARLAGVPVIVGSHRQVGDLLTPLQFAAQITAFRCCDKVICNSRAAARRLLDQGLEERKMAVLPNILSPQAFAETEPAVPPSPGVLRIGLIARMNSIVKNHRLFLRVASRLAARHRNLEFILVGDGELRPDFERMARRLGLGDRAKFLGARRDIPAVLAAVDISIVPSSSESMSNVILESMAAGKPVVAPRVGGNPEVVTDGETGLLVLPDSEDKLAEALERLIAQPELRFALGQEAKKQAAAKFSADRIRDQFEQIYTSLLAEKGWQTKQQKLVHRMHGASRRPVRVAIVAASPRWIGGHGVQADLLTRHWQSDPEVHARFIPIDPDLPAWLAWVQRVPFLRTLVREPIYLASLWRGLRNVDVVHIFSASYWSFLLAPVPALLIARLLGKKSLINYHSGEARDHLRYWRTALPVLKRAHRLVVPSRFLAEVFHEFGMKAHVIPNIVDLGQFSYGDRWPLRPLLLCTRGFHRYYRVDLVVRAFAEVQKQFPLAQLRLVGDGPLEKEIRTLVQELKLAGVEFAGRIPHKEIPRVYSESDIFVNASWLDNMPSSIQEAFASGMPVVSTAPEGIRHLVEHERTGLLCPVGDWRLLAENVIRLVRDSTLAVRLARNAYDECARYNWTCVRGQWLEMYRSLCLTESLHEETNLPENGFRPAATLSTAGPVRQTELAEQSRVMQFRSKRST